MCSSQINYREGVRNVMMEAVSWLMIVSQNVFSSSSQLCSAVEHAIIHDDDVDWINARALKRAEDFLEIHIETRFTLESLGRCGREREEEEKVSFLTPQYDDSARCK